MSLWTWLKGGDFRATGLANPDPTFVESMGVTASYSGERVTVAKALELGAVRAAVEMISKAVGVLCPLKVYRIMEDDERVEARTHRMWRILHDAPNPATTSSAFWSAVAAHLLIWENAYIGKQRDALGIVEALWLLDPTCMEVKFDGQRKTFVYTADGRQVEYTADDVLHIVGFTTSGLFGTSRIEQARQTLGTAIARAKFEGGFFKRGARYPAWIGHKGRLKQESQDNIRRQLELWHAGVENMHRIPVLEEDMQLHSLEASLEDMQFAEMAKQTRTDIAVLFGIPPAYLGGTTGDSLTYATTESNQIQFAQMAVAPVTTLIAKALSSDPGILPWDVMYAEFMLEGLMRADMKTRVDYWTKLKPLLNLDPEYIAARENIPRDALLEPEPVPPALAPPQDETEDGGEVVPLSR